MRPGQNKRMRGRNNNNNGSGNNNRKGPNPLTRSYESNGPDVKIRGTAHHVAEKYLQLARDAQSSGDPVAAESYLQHAEHYFRLIASAQQAQMGFTRQPEEAEADAAEEEDAIPDRFASPVERVPAPFVPPQPPFQAERQPFPERQPYPERQGFNGERHQGQDRNANGFDRPPRTGERTDRNDRNDRTGRGPRPYREGQDFRPHDNRGGERQGEGRPDYRMPDARQPNFRGADQRDARDGEREQPGRESSIRESPVREAPVRDAVPESRSAESFGGGDAQPVRHDAPGLPAFITAPVRVGAAASDEPAAAEALGAVPQPFRAEDAEEAVRFPRRRRRPRTAVGPDGVVDAPGDVPVIGE